MAEDGTLMHLGSTATGVSSMTDAELLTGLDDRRAMIVHLSHHAKMRENGVFPDDLLAAIANKAIWNLSCVVLWPDHAMDLPGSVGVIFRPESATNVLSVSADDAGSTQLADGSDGSLGKPLSAATFNQTFEACAGTYNEWRVTNCEVQGIFVASETSLSAKKKVPLSIDGMIIGHDIGALPITLCEVFSAFPDLPVYTLDSAGWRKLR